MWKPRTAVIEENEYISQPLRPCDNPTIIYFYWHKQSLTQFVKGLLIKLSDMIHSSNLVRLFHHQSFTLYSTYSISISLYPYNNMTTQLLQRYCKLILKVHAM